MKAAICTPHHLDEYNFEIHTIQLRIMNTFNNVDGMQTVLDKSKWMAPFTHRTTMELEKVEDQAAFANVKFRNLKNP